MRRPRAGDDNGDDRYGVRVDEPRRHLSSHLFSSSPLLLFSPSPSLLPSSSLLPYLILLPSPSSPPPPPFSFFFFLLPFFSFLLSFLLFLLPPPPSYCGRGAEARGPGSRQGELAGSRRRRRSGYGAAAGRLRRACVCVCGVCVVCVRVSGLFFIFQTSLPSARSGALGKESILPSAPDLALGEIKN